MVFEIRKAELRDLGPALALDREAFGPDAWTVMDYAAVFSENSVKKFTAVSGGKFAGFGASEWDREQNAVCLMTLAVRPEFRGRGIGFAETLNRPQGIIQKMRLNLAEHDVYPELPVLLNLLIVSL